MHTPGTFENIFFPSLPAALSHLTECYTRKRGRNTVWTDILPCVRYFRFHILSRKMFGHMSNNYHTHNKIVYARLQRAYARNTSFQCYCHFPGSHPVVSWPIYCIRGLFTKYCALIFDWLFFITNFVMYMGSYHYTHFVSIQLTPFTMPLSYTQIWESVRVTSYFSNKIIILFAICPNELQFIPISFIIRCRWNHNARAFRMNQYNPFS